ncbi:MAG TPA: hypothetical protein VMG12_17730 [Polyangiaceae bacterium]|nr:hypothetical protein [Polyangiaceae bacterium]
MTGVSSRAAFVLVLGCGGLAADGVPRFEPGGASGAGGQTGSAGSSAIGDGVPARPPRDIPGNVGRGGTAAIPPVSAPDEPSVEGSNCPMQLLAQVEVESQRELDALSGCTSIEADLSIYPFEGVDLTPLTALTRVGGMLTLGDPYTDPPPLGFQSLRGLESLRSVGGLSLRGVLAPSLEVLDGLRELTNSNGIAPTSGFVFIDQCPALENLEGLDNLRGLLGFVAKGNPRLTSLRGLQVPSAMNQVEVWDSPVVDIEALAPLTTVQYTLWFMDTGLIDTSALANVSSVDQLQFYRNAALRDLGGLSGLTSVGSLNVIENASLPAVRSLSRLTTANSISVSSNSALTEIGPFPALELLHDATITDNGALKRVAALAEIESMYQIDVSRNALLDELDLGRLVSVEYSLRVTHNPLLDSAGVPRPTPGAIIIGGNLGEAVGLDPCPWTGNTFCEAAPFDNLCAPGTDSDCPRGAF